MENVEVLYGVNEWILILLSAILFVCCSQLAFLYGRYSAKQKRIPARQFTDIIEGAIFSLMALLLGFTFMMSMSRFDARVQSLLDEANHIQTTFLRAQLLVDPYKDECKKLLREYVQARLDFYQAGIDPIKKREAYQLSDKLQGELWTRAVKAARVDINEVTSGYFIESLNGVIDDHTKRLGALNNHVPETVVWLLIVFSAMTLAVNGYIAGLNGSQTLGLRLVLIFLIVATILVTIDLDRPRRGLIQVNNRSLIEVQEFMNRSGF